MPKIELEIPAGDHCLFELKKACKVAVWNKCWHAYNCRKYNQILRGGDHPIKCEECRQGCEERQ